MTAFIELPIFHLTLTFLVYVAAVAVYARVRFFLLHPVLVTMVLVIVVLRILGVEYETYERGGRYITFFLGPSVVALGVPLYREFRALRDSAPAILVSVLLGSAVGIVSAVVPLIVAGAPYEVIVSLAPKSVTTPIAIGIVEGLGGNVSLAASVVVITGVLGAVVGPPILRLLRVGEAVAFGLAIGASSHGIGTARALEDGPRQGAAASLAICLNGIMTAILTPPLVRLLISVM